MASSLPFSAAATPFSFCALDMFLKQMKCLMSLFLLLVQEVTYEVDSFEFQCLSVLSCSVLLFVCLLLWSQE